MKVFKIFVFLFVAVSFFKCGTEEEVIDPNAPQSCFEFSSGDLYAEAPIAFDASCAKNGLVYLWEFGDGDVSTIHDPSHTYDVAGNYTVKLTLENDLGQIHTMSKNITVKPSPFIKHSGYIDVAEVWEEGLHMISGNVYIRHGSLEIKPGAEIFVNEGKSLFVGHKETTTAGGALLTAIGTGTKPIIFKPSTSVAVPGSWGHIFITEKASSSSVMEYCEVSYGGKAGSYSDWTYYTSHGIIDIDGAGISIQHSTIKGGANYGIALTEDGYFTRFEHNQLTDHIKYPIYVGMNYAHTIGTGNSITGDGIFVHAQYFQQANATWKKQDVPFILDGEKRVSHGSEGPSNLYLEPGITIAFTKNASLQIGIFSEGHLYAEGTAADPILFTSAEATKAAGDWQAVVASRNSVFRHCIFEYAGSSTYNSHSRALVAGSGTPITDCTIRNSLGDGINYGGIFTEFENNTITDCGSYGITSNSEALPHLSPTNTLTNTKGIYLSAGVVKGQVTWKKRPFPVTLAGLLIIQDTEPCSLTLVPGFTLNLTSGTSIRVAYENYLYGSLIAEGTIENPITFTLAEESIQKETGNWGYIVFGKNTTSESVFKNCILSHGGHSADNYGMIHCRNTSGAPVIENTKIANSDYYAITSYLSSPVITNVSYESNASGDFYEVQ